MYKLASIKFREIKMSFTSIYYKCSTTDQTGLSYLSGPTNE